ncbi:tRNA (adenosine(37)-N6)-threonylcarbamoyltransferase complex dimerization subunit type 1 TsaB [Thermosulfurimonas marina]|uniref:tRNA (Adenosine(37)-N6)-threonylcarbamoyltransferase complex dimerization subunit type 1 TsaB n=1 Tax=Thermosulfurimonas marina TaxID=2047767 RepID=A0A6H1WQA0_9BACT|nr:tRNA (adenosine(37)-N6)-threonylcarbamoyltransferase complex dimerization subunit type 1 TsaB [Thermosulfurimonas marina]QJA05340.1 tRNA (adenosine(37)-N6)-threonylcarbamoyltransferase complex dimerization subunit type 1 TsaB [Thermosulfurimonas marina]
MGTQAPLILAFETSGETGGVALYQGRVLAEVTLSGALTYSRRLLPALDFLLGQLGLRLSQIEALAVAVGPGSFTGLRIGLATVKALALVLQRPVVGVETLAALAAQVPESPLPVCAVLDARRGELYAALYRMVDGYPQVFMRPRIISPERLCAEISGPTLFVGEGLRLFREELRRRLGERFREAPGHLREGRAAAVAYLAERRLLSGSTDDPATLLPFYLRPSEAERSRGLGRV